MADRADTTRNRPARKAAITSDADLSALIEDERDRLRRAEAILGCALVAMDEPQGFPGARRVDYSGAVELARDLVKKSIDQLDAVRLGPIIEKLRDENTSSRASQRGDSGFEVREPRPGYLN